MDMPRIANRSFDNNPPTGRSILVRLRALLALLVNPIRKLSLDLVQRSLGIETLRFVTARLLLIDSIDFDRTIIHYLIVLPDIRLSADFFAIFDRTYAYVQDIIFPADAELIVSDSFQHRQAI